MLNFARNLQREPANPDQLIELQPATRHVRAPATNQSHPGREFGRDVAGIVPSSASRVASGAPRPRAPSMAQVAPGQRLAKRRSWREPSFFALAVKGQ